MKNTETIQQKKKQLFNNKNVKYYIVDDVIWYNCNSVLAAVNIKKTRHDILKNIDPLSNKNYILLPREILIQPICLLSILKNTHSNESKALYKFLLKHYKSIENSKLLLKYFDWYYDNLKISPKATYVYFIKMDETDDSNIYKIGITNNLKNRIKSINTHNFNIISEYVSIKSSNTLKLEKALHEKYKENKLRREFFKFDKHIQISDLIEEAKKIETIINEVYYVYFWYYSWTNVYFWEYSFILDKNTRSMRKRYDLPHYFKIPGALFLRLSETLPGFKKINYTSTLSPDMLCKL